MQDTHIHMFYGKSDSPSGFMEKAAAAGLTGGTIFGLPPEKHHKFEGENQSWQYRLDLLLQFTSQTPGFRSVFWMDPTEPDAAQQVTKLAESHVAGIKVICNHFYPADALKIWHQIAETGLPVMFHSGILYNFEEPGGSEYNRPLTFECLIKVRKMRFSMAHISWPWVDECVALFGEFNACSNESEDGMYVDLTPGTPAVYRKDALQKLFCSVFSNGLDKIIWGTDSTVNNYNAQISTELQAKDQRLINQITADPEFGDPSLQNLWEKVSERNINRFFKDGLRQKYEI